MKGDTTLGKILQCARVRNGYTVRAWAELLDYAPSTVQTIESGAARMSPAFFIKVREHLTASEISDIITVLVYRHLYPYGLSTPLKASKVLKYHIISAHIAGSTQRDIARMYKVPIGQVQYAIDKFNKLKTP